MKVSRIEVLLESGLGTTTGQGQRPTLMLRSSTDGGKTWGVERTASAGAMGEYQTRCLFWRMGQARNRVFELSVSDPIPWRILDSFIDVAQESA